MNEKKTWRFPLYDDRETGILNAENVASATECTGLIPSAPADEHEMDSYASLYSIPNTKKPDQKGKPKQ